MFKHICVPVDNSDCSNRAIDLARRITAKTIDEEPKWRTPGSKLLTGYKSEWR